MTDRRAALDEVHQSMHEEYHGTMARNEMIRLAREAGVEFKDRAEPRLERFAELVAAAEREACAKVAESYEPTCDTCPSGVANAIRARGET